jgi:hypothetical protein
MQPLASAGAVMARSEIAVAAQAKILFMSFSQEPMVRWSQNTAGRKTVPSVDRVFLSTLRLTPIGERRAVRRRNAQ